jgi:hypothetical protein
MNGKMMWSERFLKEGSVKQDSYGQNYEVWIPVNWFVPPTEDLLKKLEAAAQVAAGTRWRPQYGGPALRWISDRSFNRIQVIGETGQIWETYVVLNEREAMAD